MYPKPFDKYPQEWHQKPPPQRTGANCRHGYGLELHKRTGQSTCAYCGHSLIDEYEHWLLMAVDHVVPTEAGNKIGIPKEYLGSWANCVLACCVCNLFKNRSIDLGQPRSGRWQDLSWQQFLDLRDDTFRKRQLLIAKDKPRDKEREYYRSKWKNAPGGA